MQGGREPASSKILRSTLNGGTILVHHRSRIAIALTLAVLLLGITAAVGSASRVSPWVGRWQSMDVPGDGSTNTLSITFRGSASHYGLIWQETYFSICGGAPRIGRGTGDESGGLHTQISFYCRGTLWGTVPIEFIYDSANDFLISGQGTPTETVWERISPRPW
jgi:hypothetical protein